MDMREVFAQRPVLAIMRNVPLEDTLYYAGAVVAGGVKIFEVALNSVHGYEQIAILRKEFGEDVMIGAGLGSNIMPKESVKAKDWKACAAYVAELVKRANAGIAAYKG